ncbi:MAG: 16S rRNA (adenine(1518)-N(6)/adenine(1519)-N(6))-dimethyltransferase RsmA, partial [Acetobacteraceae bacterium]|nr:16S rRNA (adenine(1518)-N(6)/adenine(1519)-N(6))-dimethyltransferase RsmA [Acetobacteraceae bacterium]MBV8520577.1 16S rRNA (adenine(1518)-N(6)/adenine(1519)-N(6))-dimethyltransferase RsmA [Acetobacteraceae bacterium]
MGPPLRDVIARHGLTARKPLGQHFLLDLNLAARIVRAAGNLARRHVVEIGPGPGGLTRALLATDAASITAIEVDPRAVGAIEELASVSAGRLRVIAADALAMDLARIVPPPRAIVANLPYNIGTRLLIGWLGQAADFERFTLMFQQEVAERMCASPGSAPYGRLAVLAQWTCRTELVLRIPPAAFVPPPKVWSAVVRLDPKPSQPEPGLFATMERITAAAFGQRRKMLRSALAQFGGEAFLCRAGIAPDRRAETLSVAEFDCLARIAYKACPPDTEV